MAKVSCVILNYNDYRTTIELIRNLENSTIIDNIVIVDNNSTDISYDVLKSEENNKIIVIKSISNKGYGAGNNIGILFSKDVLNADYVIVANPDVSFEDHFIKKCIEAFSSDSDLAIVTGKMLNKDGKPEMENSWNIKSPIHEIVDTSSILKRIIAKFTKSLKVEKTFNDREYVDVVSGSLFVADINKICEIGLFDEEIFLYGEEKVIAIKLKQRGYRTLILNSINYIHYHSISIDKTYKNILSKRRLLIRSKKIILRKYYNISKLKLELYILLLNLIIIEAIVIEIAKLIKIPKLD